MTVGMKMNTKMDVGTRTRKMVGNLREKKWLAALAGPSFQPTYLIIYLILFHILY